jgi:protein gp37
MGVETGIEWCSHTFNAWRGCTKVSPGCANCYAEKLSHRNPEVLGIWGDNGTRAIAAESYWRQPLAWDKAAAKAGERRRVFCASLADVFEDRPELVAPRRRLWEVIVRTLNLDWLLLTKRPENVARMLGPNGINFYAREGPVPCPQPNVWIGTSVEDQQRADERIPHLLNTPAAVRFLSMEPLLGPVRLRNVPGLNKLPTVHRLEGRGPAGIDWVIVGGESGPNARPMHPDWARSLRDQCTAAGVAFFFKQWGEWLPYDNVTREQVGDAFHWSTNRVKLDDDKLASRVGKKAAGRLLDGREWSEFPSA